MTEAGSSTPAPQTSHSAPGSAAGYLYQCERALLELVSLAANNREITLFMERLDDIHLEENGRPIDILQVKHHLGAGADLTDQSPDVWRSIRVWMDLLPQQAADSSPYFTLLSTGEAPASSAAEALGTGETRDAQAAQALLEAAAGESTNESTRESREQFLAMSSADRKRLVDAIRVRGSGTRLDELEPEIARLMRLDLYFRPNQVQSYVERLKGWWYGRCVELLTNGGSITTAEFKAFTQNLREQFHPEDLPDDFGMDEPPEGGLDQYSSSVFVQQLKWIAYTNDQLLDAIRDYYRAFTHRSRWTREGLLYPGELARYERKLVAQWQRVFHDIVAELGEEAAETEKQAAGRSLLQGLRDSDAVRLRNRYSEIFLTHGSLHQLANDRRLGWHPDFERRLEELLAGVA